MVRWLWRRRFFAVRAAIGVLGAGFAVEHLPDWIVLSAFFALGFFLALYNLYAFRAMPRKEACMFCGSLNAAPFPREGAREVHWYRLRRQADIAWVCAEHLATYLRMRHVLSRQLPR